MIQGRMSLPCLVYIVIVSSHTFAADVIVEGEEGGFGQGILAFGRDEGCLVLTPGHVCKRAGRPCPSVRVYRLAGAPETAILLADAPSDWDFTVYALAQDSRLCHTLEFRFAADVPAALSRKTLGTLKKRESDGSRYQLAVEVQSITDSHIRVAPLNPARTIETGFSGADLVLDGGVFVGIVKSVEGGVASVSRIDYLEKFLRNYIGSGRADTPALPSVLARVELTEEHQVSSGVTIELVRTSPQSRESKGYLTARSYISGKIDYEKAVCWEDKACVIRLHNIEIHLQISNVTERTADIEIGRLIELQ